MSEIYEPKEDSYLLCGAIASQLPELLDKNSNLKFLDMGCGSGIVLESALNGKVKKSNILGADINSKAVTHCKKFGFNCVKSDLFEKVKGKFDVISFNPPYLPLDKKEPKSSRRETTGGKKGNELSLRFLEEAKEHLNKNGRVFIVTSSLAAETEFKKLGYKSKKIAEEKVFFEKLSVFLLTVA